MASNSPSKSDGPDRDAGINTKNEGSDSALCYTELTSSAMDSALSEEKAIGIIPDSISPILGPLISELHQVNIRFERLESLLIRLVRSCYNGKDFTLQTADYLVSNYDVLHCLYSLAEKTLEGKYCTTLCRDFFGESPSQCNLPTYTL